LECEAVKNAALLEGTTTPTTPSTEGGMETETGTEREGMDMNMDEMCPLTNFLMESTKSLCIQGTECKRCYIPELISNTTMMTNLELATMPQCPPCVYAGLNIESPARKICNTLYVGSSLLIPEKEVPPQPAGESFGRGVAGYELDTLNNVLSFWLSWSNLTTATIEGHIHRGFVNESGPIVFPFLPPTEGVNGTITELQVIANHGFVQAEWKIMSLEVMQRLLAGGYYFNVHSQMFPLGEIREQIILNKTDKCITECKPLLGVESQNGIEMGEARMGLGRIQINTSAPVTH